VISNQGIPKVCHKVGVTGLRFVAGQGGGLIQLLIELEGWGYGDPGFYPLIAQGIQGTVTLSQPQ